MKILIFILLSLSGVFRGDAPLNALGVSGFVKDGHSPAPLRKPYGRVIVLLLLHTYRNNDRRCAPTLSREYIMGQYFLFSTANICIVSGLRSQCVFLYCDGKEVTESISLDRKHFLKVQAKKSDFLDSLRYQQGLSHI